MVYAEVMAQIHLCMCTKQRIFFVEHGSHDRCTFLTILAHEADSPARVSGTINPRQLATTNLENIIHSLCSSPSYLLHPISLAIVSEHRFLVLDIANRTGNRIGMAPLHRKAPFTRRGFQLISMNSVASSSNSAMTRMYFYQTTCSYLTCAKAPSLPPAPSLAAPAPHITTMPDEILLQIIQSTHPTAIACLAVTCTRMHRLIKPEEIPKDLNTVVSSPRHPYGIPLWELLKRDRFLEEREWGGYYGTPKFVNRKMYQHIREQYWKLHPQRPFSLNEPNAFIREGGEAVDVKSTAEEMDTIPGFVGTTEEMEQLLRLIGSPDGVKDLLDSVGDFDAVRGWLRTELERATSPEKSLSPLSLRQWAPRSMVRCLNSFPRNSSPL